MIPLGRINAVLEKLGSPHRAVHGGSIDDTIAFILEAFPPYIEKLVSEEVERRLAVELLNKST
jgi:hypothetical protein